MSHWTVSERNDTVVDLHKEEGEQADIPYSARRVVLVEFKLNDIAESGDITYFGEEDRDGNWMVVKFDETSDTSVSYATVVNNDTVTDYSTAWAARATTLVYGDYGTVIYE